MSVGCFLGFQNGSERTLKFHCRARVKGMAGSDSAAEIKGVWGGVYILTLLTKVLAFNPRVYSR